MICPHSGREILPDSLFKLLGDWAYNSHHYKTLSPMDEYRVLARLASVDKRGTHDLALGPCSYGLISNHAWGNHANSAYFGITEALGASSLIISGFESEGIKEGLARYEQTSTHFSFKADRRLSSSNRKKLVEILSEFETRLTDVQSLQMAGNTIEEQVMEVKDPVYQMSRREVFTRFSLEQ